MRRKWVSYQVQNRQAFMSTLCISSAHLDVMRGEERDSMVTTAVRAEAAHLIKSSLSDPQRCCDDSTIIATVHLLAAEFMKGEDHALMPHEHGLKEMVAMRGGLDKLGLDGQIAAILTV